MRDAHEGNEHGELTHFKNGDRFVYAKKLINPALDRFTKIAGRSSRIYHEGQFNKCKICGEQGHKTGDTVCPAYIAETLKIETLFSYEHPLSNFYPCDVLFRGKKFKSAEHAIQWTKASDLGLNTTDTKCQARGCSKSYFKRHFYREFETMGRKF